MAAGMPGVSPFPVPPNSDRRTTFPEPKPLPMRYPSRHEIRFLTKLVTLNTPFMKASTSLPIIALFLLLVASTCKKSDADQVGLLPAATQTGAGTFGCLINGQAFLPAGNPLSGPNLACTYQYIYPNSASGYVFGISAGDKSNTCNITEVGLGLDSVSTISQGIYCLLYTSPSPRDGLLSRMPSSA